MQTLELCYMNSYKKYILARLNRKLIITAAIMTFDVKRKNKIIYCSKYINNGNVNKKVN